MKNNFREKFADNFLQAPVVAILRGVTPDTVIEAAESIIKSGIRFLEVTMNSPEAIKSIDALNQEYKDSPNICIGAGTVLTAEQVKEVVSAGGRFIISPNTCIKVIETSKALGAISIPGFLTPSEAFAAIDAGADYLKLFPAGRLGAGYVKDLKAVLSKPIIATGGIGLHNIREFLQVCSGVAIGSNLYSYGKTPEHLYKDACEIMRQAGKK